MRPWKNLGFVETIYEEDHDEYYSSPSSSSSSTSILSPSGFSPNTPLQSRVEAWSEVTGSETDVLIHVQGTAFYLHKERLSSRSAFLRRQLTKRSEVTLSPPLKITPKTFTLVADFCYGSHIAVTPKNVAALRLAADLLQMKETDAAGEENLWKVTETYFRRVIAGSKEYASAVLRSCLALLPEVETTSSLVGRCFELLNSEEGGDGVDSCLEEIIALRFDDFKTVADSMHRRFSCHDPIYTIVDFYFEEQSGKLTEEEKTQLCNSIDCNLLSPELLVQAVQNPKMPLRFIVRAMLVEQLNTRRSIAYSVDINRHSRQQQNREAGGKPTTLGNILQREAAIRETGQLRASMDATSSRIESLEREIQGMKKILEDAEVKRLETEDRRVLVSGKSKSFHYESREKSKLAASEQEKKVSASSRFARGGREVGVSGSSSSSTPENWASETPRSKKKNIGLRLINGIKNRLRIPNSGSETKKVAGKSGGLRCGVKLREELGNSISPPQLATFATDEIEAAKGTRNRLR